MKEVRVVGVTELVLTGGAVVTELMLRWYGLVVFLSLLTSYTVLASPLLVVAP